MQLDLSSLPQWASALAAVVALALSVVSNVRSARKAELTLVHDRISKVRDAGNVQAERLAKVEAALEHLPTREMVQDLSTSLARLEGKIEAVNVKSDGLSDRIRGIGTAVDQLVENELRGRS